MPRNLGEATRDGSNALAHNSPGIVISSRSQITVQVRTGERISGGYGALLLIPNSIDLMNEYNLRTARGHSSDMNKMIGQNFRTIVHPHNSIIHEQMQCHFEAAQHFKEELFYPVALNWAKLVRFPIKERAVVV